ncbi:MAG: DUF2634 domain-containing protein [Halobacteriales archaeon]|nr:DUF2634 domain-containing protein [Halobacteriales archaeon]
MPQLLPDGLLDPALDEPVSQTPVTYGKSWEFHMNPESCSCSDLQLDIPHLGVRGKKVMRTEGVDSLIQWIRMTLATERYRWEIYDHQYGTEFVDLIEGSLPEDEAETEVIRAVREAILTDPRVASVTSVRLTEGRDLEDPEPAAFVAEVRVVTFTGELKQLKLDTSLRGEVSAYLDS